VEINLSITFPFRLAIDRSCYFVTIVDNFIVVARLATEGEREKAFKLRNFHSCRDDYRYWTSYYGLPVAGWNAGNDGKDYHNHEA